MSVKTKENFESTGSFVSHKYSLFVKLPKSSLILYGEVFSTAKYKIIIVQ